MVNYYQEFHYVIFQDAYPTKSSIHPPKIVPQLQGPAEAQTKGPVYLGHPSCSLDVGLVTEPRCR